MTTSKSVIDNFYLNHDEPIKSSLQAIREIIMTHHEAISETVKYGMPCYCYHKKILCYVWLSRDTKQPYVLIANGNKIDHPKLVQGDRARMKIFPIAPNKNIAIKTVKHILNLAIAVTS